jgi:hypothetical protein
MQIPVRAAESLQSAIVLRERSSSYLQKLNRSVPVESTSIPYRVSLLMLPYLQNLTCQAALAGEFEIIFLNI